ncbi:unnamed protein product [Chrysoparadoxa australica]
MESNVASGRLGGLGGGAIRVPRDAPSVHSSTDSTMFLNALERARAEDARVTAELAAKELYLQQYPLVVEERLARERRKARMQAKARAEQGHSERASRRSHRKEPLEKGFLRRGTGKRKDVEKPEKKVRRHREVTIIEERQAREALARFCV